MKTKSQEYKEKVEQYTKELQLYVSEVEYYQGLVEKCQANIDDARVLFVKHRDEERRSRRSYVADPCFPRLAVPNAGPSGEYERWKKLQVIVCRHPHYSIGKADWKEKDWRKRYLLLSLMRFNQQMYGLCNFQAWNPRNKNPHLP